MKKILNILILLIFVSSIFAQDYYPFSEQEILDITNEMKELEYSDSIKTELILEYKFQIKNYQQLIKLDSLTINYKNKQIELLKELNDLNKQTWWEENDKYFYFIGGVLTIIGGALIVKEVNEK